MLTFIPQEGFFNFFFSSTFWKPVIWLLTKGSVILHPQHAPCERGCRLPRHDFSLSESYCGFMGRSAVL